MTKLVFTVTGGGTDEYGEAGDCQDRLSLRFEDRSDALQLIADLAQAMQTADEHLDEMGGLFVSRRGMFQEVPTSTDG